MLDVPAAAETDFAETAARPPASAQPAAGAGVSQTAVSQTAASETAAPETAAFQTAAFQTAAFQPLASQPLSSRPLSSRPLDSELLGSEPLGSEPLGSEPLGSEPLDFRPLDSRPLDSEPLGAQSLGSRPLGAQPLDSSLPDGPPLDAPKKCPDALAAEITTLAGHLNAAQYRFLKLIDEFDRAQGWAGPGVRSLAHWLELKCGLGDLAAREKVRVARALRELPSIDAAFERGEISYSKVRAMTRVATPENEKDLLVIARHGTAEHMEKLVRVYRKYGQRADASPGETARRREERFYCFVEDDEMMVFGGRVSVEQGRLLIKALDAMVAEMEADEREAGEAETTGNVSAETSAAAAEPGVSAETSAVASEPSVSAETSAATTETIVSAETSAATTETIVSAETSAATTETIVSAGTSAAGSGAGGSSDTMATASGKNVSAETSEAASVPNVSAETSAGSSRASARSETTAPASGRNVSAETPVTGSVASGSSDALAAASGKDVSAGTSVPASVKNVSAETVSDGRTGVEPHEPDRPPLKPLRVRRATALAQIAEHYLATRRGGTGATPLKPSDAYQVFVHVNANDAHPDNRINGAHTTYMDDRRCVAPHVARQLACDASRRTVLENERGEVLNIGRRSRIVPWHIVHALRIRDGGCRFPGCNQHRWTDAHHIHHWADGGETSLENLVTLCRYHHRELHRDEYRIEHGADGELIFIDKWGEAMLQAIHPQFTEERGSGGVAGTAAPAAIAGTAGATHASTAADRCEHLQAEHRNRGVEIDESTAVRRWAGERMDYSTAVEWMQYADGVAI